MSGKKACLKLNLDSTAHYYLRDAQGNAIAIYKKTYVNIGLSSTYIQAECNIFGSSRVGVYYPPDRSMISDSPGRIATRYRNYRRYEVSNHLGNVMSVVTDRLKGNPAALPQRVSAYEPDIVAAQDYYPFGQVMRSRNFPTTTSGKTNFPTKYRYGFNDKEADADGEIQNLTTYDYGFRIYNPGIARFLSVDPLTSSYPYYTPYQFAGNGPIANIDLDGLEPQSKGKENEVRCAPDQKSGVEGDWTYRGDDIGWTPNSIEEVVITPEKTNNRLEVFNNWRYNPFFNNGETPLDRWIRLGGAFAHETSRDYAAGGFNMYNGFARIKPAVNIIKYVDEVEVVAAKGGFKIEGQLAEIFGNKKLFSNWLKGNHSLSRVGNPLNATEAQQIINNAKNLGLPIESNLKGLQGLEITGQWGGIPHFKVGNVHIPIEKGLDGVLKF